MQPRSLKHCRIYSVFLPLPCRPPCVRSPCDSATMLLQACSRSLIGRSSTVTKMPLRAKILNPSMTSNSSRKVSSSGQQSSACQCLRSLTDLSHHSSQQLPPRSSRSCPTTIRTMSSSARNMECERLPSTDRRSSIPWTAACVVRSYPDCRNGAKAKWRTSL